MIEGLLEKIQKLMRSNSNSTALARDVGVTRQVIDKYKKGKSKLKNMTAENLMKFEKYMEENEMNINKNENKECIGADRFSHEALQNVYFDEGNGTYDLEFLVNGEKHYRQVKASDHPEAATNEDYFDDKLVVDKIIMEIPED